MFTIKLLVSTVLSILILSFVTGTVYSQQFSKDKQADLFRLPDSIISSFTPSEDKSVETDPYLCHDEDYFQSIAYYWRCPDQYGDDMYAMKFERNFFKHLSFIKMMLYDKEDSTTNYDSGFYVVVLDDNFGFPGDEIARFRIYGEDVVLYPDTFKLDIIDTNIFAGMPLWQTEEFYVAIQNVEGAEGAIAIISDDGNFGQLRSFERYTVSGPPPDTIWSTMLEGWNLDVNFCMMLEYCFYPKTVRVPEDYLSINEAALHVSSYDTILVNDGYYDFGGTASFVSKDLVIQSVNGPEHTIINGTDLFFVNSYLDDSHHYIEFDGFTMQNCSDAAITASTNYSLTIKNSVFLNNYSLTRGGAIYCGGLELFIENCTFYNNSTGDSGAVLSITGGNPTISNTIIANSSGSYAIESLEFASSYPTYSISCSNFYGNELGDWTDRIASLAHVNGNISEDPLFCDPDNGDFHINEMSFCNAAHPLNSCSEQIGYFGVSCFGCNDADIDGICDENDNCIDISNPSQLDSDYDDIGDVCDPCTADSENDIDADSLCADEDNCPTVYNPAQVDSDADGIGDLCDNCVEFYNPDQLDTDNDGVADACDDCTDSDNDGFGNPGFPMNTCPDDNCSQIYNPDQIDLDLDGIGYACDGCIDPDADGFGSPGELNPLCDEDNCADIFNPDQIDSDGDGIGDACDNCRFAFNDNQSDVDLDGVGDSCDTCTDTDNDGYGDPGFPNNICFDDNCPTISNVDQLDSDLDGIGDVCDSCYDPDNDGFGSPGYQNTSCELDNCPNRYNPDQFDTDADGIGDACCCIGIRGNIDYDSGDNIDIADLIYFINYSFGIPFGPPPGCPVEADVDATGALDVGDIVYLIAYMFGGGDAPLICPGM